MGFSLLGWALAFLILAVIAAVFGFGLLAAASAWIAKVLFIIFIVAFLISLVIHVSRRV